MIMQIYKEKTQWYNESNILRRRSGGTKITTEGKQAD